MVRMRRNRHDSFSRRLVRETTLSPNDLILPVFVQEGEHRRDPIPTMPGVSRLSIDELLEVCQECVDLGVPMIALFPHIEQELKTPDGREAHNPDGLIPRTIKAVKEKFPELGIMTDVALDPYTTHGQDGLIDDTGFIMNDETVEQLVLQSLCQARAGADVIAPSDMMDGRIGTIRRAFEKENLIYTRIMAYSAKYASSYYGPFRDAAESAPHHGDRKTYQMDPANAMEGLREAAADIDEGADIVMVKPAGPYLDVIRMVRDNFDVPVAAYQVSGEYSMIKAAAINGWIDEERIVLESLIGIRRAGAKLILTYYAEEALKKGWVR